LKPQSLRIPRASYRVGILHGSGYAGGELIRLLLGHPSIKLARVTSRSFDGQPVWAAHPDLRGQTDLHFSTSWEDLDAIFCTAEHGQAAHTIPDLLDQGFSGPIVDLSADFRFKSQHIYPAWFTFHHPAPELLETAQYGLPELFAPYPEGTQLVANPGCFATGITLALAPLAKNLPRLSASVTALTGASGAGLTPRPTTHFPNRSGNVRAYKPLEHQHLPEVLEVLGDVDVHFVPCSGPWVRGIWGTAHVTLPAGIRLADVTDWFEKAYMHAPAVRLWPELLPELRFSVDTPFVDIGWLMKGDHLVVGFALDNLLKGAAAQAVQNLNLLLGLPEMAGLIPPTQAGVVADPEPEAASL
jgi:LysW-gamma-L-alpha-aminoadipyl-6-phosphate/LysW-L-glutamyl-5-phosphate reductase